MNLAWWRSRFEIDHGHAGHVNRPMEGARGFAVALVFLVHYTTLAMPWIAADPIAAHFADAVHAVGNAGVDLFFVLSGYLIYGSLIGRHQPFLRYMLRREQRIYPTFAVVFAIYVALSVAMPSQSRIPHGFAAATTYLVSNALLLPGILPREPMITVAWSLSYEMFYYLAMPALIGLLGLRRRSAGWRVGFFALVAAAMLAIGTTYGGPVRLVMFIVGVLLFEARSATVWTASGPVAAVVLAAGLAAPLLPGTSSAAFAAKILLLGGACFVFFRTSFAGPDSGLRRALCWTPLRWFGNMSYSYYLLHGLALKAGFMVAERLLPPTGHGVWMFWVLLPPMFALTVGASMVLFLLIERPFSLDGARSTGARLARLQASADGLPRPRAEEGGGEGGA